MLLSDLFEPLTLVEIDDSNKIDQLNARIHNFDVINRDNLKFILNFIQTTNDSVFLVHFLTEEIKDNFQYNRPKVNFG